MADYVLPVSGNPDPKQLNYLKHPLQDFLRRFLGGWIMVRPERRQQALIITGYDGPMDRLREGISRKAQAPHAKTTGIALDVSHLEEIVGGGQDIQPAVETDETLRQDIEVLQGLLATEAEQGEARLQEAKDECHLLEGRYKLKERELEQAHEALKGRAEQAHLLERKLEGAGKANKGLADNYIREKERADELEKKIFSIEKSAKTPEELRIDAVRKSAQNIKSLEQELQALGVSDLQAILEVPASLVAYANGQLNAAYQSDDEVRSAANFRPALPDTAAELAYAEAKKDVKFYDVVKSSGAEVPEPMKVLFESLGENIDSRRKVIADYELAQKQSTEHQLKASKVQELIDKHTKLLRARVLLEKLPEIFIYSVADGLTNHTYLPVGVKGGFVYALTERTFGINGADVLEGGLVEVIRNGQGAGLAALKAHLARFGIQARVLVEDEI